MVHLHGLKNDFNLVGKMGVRRRQRGRVKEPREAVLWVKGSTNQRDTELKTRKKCIMRRSLDLFGDKRKYAFFGNTEV